MTDKEHKDYCTKRFRMFTEMMERCYPETKKN